MENNDKKYYVYVYYDKDIPIYVGYGHGNRMTNHFRKSVRKQRKTYFYNKIEKMLKNDNIPLCKKIYQDLTKEDAIFYEKETIKQYGRLDNKTGILYNLTDGGDGGSGSIYTEERKNLISSWSKGKKLSQEHIKKLIEFNTGKCVSSETKLKISLAQKGVAKPKSKNSRQNYINASKIRCSNYEYIRKLKDASRNRNNNSLYEGMIIIQKDYNGNIIDTYDNIYEICDKINARPDRILKCINGLAKKHKGFKWEGKYVNQ